MLLTFEEFQDLILKHPLLGDDGWEFSRVRDETQRPHYHATKLRRTLYRLNLVYSTSPLPAEERWRVMYYYHGRGKTLDEALKNFFAGESHLC